MFETKNVLMLVVLSTGLLTALTGTGASVLTPAFAIDDDCEDNGDDSCTEENQKVHQENDCKIVNENENDDDSDSNTYRDTGNGDITCWNFAQNPEDGDAIANEDDEVSNEPGDVEICHNPTGNPQNGQTLSLSQNAADSHLQNHPFDTLGPCQEF
jgi:hypothetical protein